MPVTKASSVARWAFVRYSSISSATVSSLKLYNLSLYSFLAKSNASKKYLFSLNILIFKFHYFSVVLSTSINSYSRLPTPIFSAASIV